MSAIPMISRITSSKAATPTATIVAVRHSKGRGAEISTAERIRSGPAASC
jgi:hypothetical protein